MDRLTVRELELMMSQNKVSARKLSLLTDYSKDYIKRVLNGRIAINPHFEEAVREAMAGGVRYKVIESKAIEQVKP